MKASLLFSFSWAVLVAASPLGDRALFSRHNAAQHTRRYLLRSRLDSPLACAALSGTTTDNSTSSDPLTAANSTLPDPTTTDNSTLSNPTATDNSTLPDPTTTSDSTLSDPTSADNSTSTINSTSLETSSRRRRFWRRIAQDDLPDVALSWQTLCLVSGGDIVTDDPCVKLAGIDGINALLDNADPCAQQDNADAMITFAKSAGVNNTDDLIANAIAYRQHPRNAVDILGVVPSTPYCQRAPVNPELNGVVNGQLDGVDPGLFGSPEIPIVPFGAPGTCPFGLTPDVATCSCVNDTDASGATSTVTDDNSTATDDSLNTSAPETSSLTSTDVSDPTATSIAESDSAAVSAGDASSSTDIANSSASVAISSAASVSSTSAASASATTASVTSVASATPAATIAAPPAATTIKSSGPNFQPDDIDGDVNDVDG